LGLFCLGAKVHFKSKLKFLSWLEPKPDETTDFKAIMNRSVRESMTTEAQATFTGGAIIVAFAVHLGASNFTIGVLAGIPPLMQLLQFPAVFLIEKIRRRRLLYAVTAFGGRLQWLLAALIPLLWPNKFGLFLFVLGFIIRGMFLSVSNLSLISLLQDIVPWDHLGEFFGKRMRFAAGISIVLSLAAGFFIDFWADVMPEQAILAYSFLYFMGFILGLISIYFVIGLPEPVMVPTWRTISHQLKAPFKDLCFSRLMFFLGSWNFAVNLAVPFFTVYMLRQIGLELTQIISLWVISQLVSILFMKKWGTLADRYSNKSVIKICAPAFLLSIIAWTFTTTPGPHYLTIPLLIVIHIVMGFSVAGTSLAAGNIVLKLAPKGSANAYIAARTMINSIAAGLAPIIGGTFADFFADQEVSLSFSWQNKLSSVNFQAINLSHWDFFFILACVLGYASLFLLRRVEEKGEVKDGVVLGELMLDMWRDLRIFSTFEGLRSMFHYPVVVLPKLQQMVLTERSVDNSGENRDSFKVQPSGSEDTLTGEKQ